MASMPMAYSFSHACFRTYICDTILLTLQPCHYLCVCCGRLFDDDGVFSCEESKVGDAKRD